MTQDIILSEEGAFVVLLAKSTFLNVIFKNSVDLLQGWNKMWVERRSENRCLAWPLEVQINRVISFENQRTRPIFLSGPFLSENSLRMQLKNVCTYLGDQFFLLIITTINTGI